MITGTDFVAVHATDLERASAFYRDALGLERAVFIPERGYSEYETGNLTLAVIDPEKLGIAFSASKGGIALHVDDVAARRAELEARGVTFFGEVLDTGVCHMAFFQDPDGNAFLLHHRYAPRTTEAQAAEATAAG